MLQGNYLIIGVSVFFLLGMVVTYSLSLSSGHISFLWCYISYTGNFPVESCIFSAVLNVCSGLYLLIIILRHCQISEVIENSALEVSASKSMQRLNKISSVFGVLGSMGLSITGCFQQRNFHLMHFLGVVFCTCGTNIYFVFQTYFSFTLLSEMTKISVKVFRLVTVVLSTTDLAAGAALLLYYFFHRPRRILILSAPSTPSPSDVYKAGTTLEWILFTLFQLFIYSFGWDFKKIGLKRNQLIFLE